MGVYTHTADRLEVAKQYRRSVAPLVVLETALPIKFASTIVEALGREPERPPKFAGIENLPKRVQVMDADVQAIKAYIAAACA